MELFSSDFPHPNEPTADEHEAQHHDAPPAVSVDDQAPAHLEHDPNHTQPPPEGTSADGLPDASVDGDLSAADATLRGKMATQGLSVAQKKERQKQQNRRAAERSRNKKREELTALEMTVNNIQDENHRLRTRLASLLSTKPGEAAQPVSEEAVSSVPTGIDYAQLSRLQAELAAAKATLLERELELGKAHGGHATERGDEIRASLLTSGTALASMQSEVKALHSVISHIRIERDNLARQRDTLSRELEARRVLRDTVNETSQGGHPRAAGVERALLDLRGMVDGVIKRLVQSSVLPSRRVEGSETDTAAE